MFILIVVIIAYTMNIITNEKKSKVYHSAMINLNIIIERVHE